MYGGGGGVGGGIFGGNRWGVLPLPLQYLLPRVVGVVVLYEIAIKIAFYSVLAMRRANGSLVVIRGCLIRILA